MAVTLRRLRTALKKENPSLIWVEIDALTPPWKVSDEYWDKYSQASVEDDDESKLLEPWSEDLPQKIGPDDQETFARLQATYAAAVSQLDAALSELTSDAAQQGPDDTIWMITSPYALPLGVHGAVGLPSPLHTEFVHLPLMIVWPNSEHSGRRVHALTQSMDLAPTIAELLGIPWQADDSLVSGKSLLPLVESASANIRTHAISTDRRGGYAVRSPNWCLLHHPQQSPQLFVKPDDRWEVNDLAQHNLEVLDELKEVYSKQFNREAT
jgi:arylsulfatase A-like enzyme